MTPRETVVLTGYLLTILFVLSAYDHLAFYHGWLDSSLVLYWINPHGYSF